MVVTRIVVWKDVLRIDLLQMVLQFFTAILYTEHCARRRMLEDTACKMVDVGYRQ